MSVAPFAGVVALDNFKSPTVAVDGIQGQVPKPLAGQNGYVLTADGWVPIGTAGAVTSVGTAGTVNGITLTGGPITTSGTITLGGTLDLSSPPAIGGTTPAAGTFTTLIGGGDAANYGQRTGGATTKAVQFRTLGTDTNISMALQPKGTGAIDLAAGSSGVNISNGGTVTAVTLTAAGSSYTSAPTWTATAPTTAGGTQASGTTTLRLIGGGAAIASGGTGYTVGDVLTFSGGTFTTAATVTVSTVSTGVITAITISNNGAYSVLPSNPISVTGGTGTGATFNGTWGVASLAISVAGSGYVEQPTVTFSGGGGSGAAAYATVGSGTPIIRSLGTNLSFYTPAGEQVRVLDGGNTSTGHIRLTGSTSNSNGVYLTSSANAMYLSTSAGNNFRFFTNGEGSAEQFRVAHTASAVNYVQVTGSSTTNWANISTQGSDSNISLSYYAKGAGNHIFATNNSSSGVQFRVLHVAGTIVNYAGVNGAVTGSAPAFSVAGTDTDIDLALTPKGAGNVRFATYTAGIIAQAGYLTIKDSGGTVRRLLVG